MALILATITLILLTYLLQQKLFNKGKKLPPGPKGFPIIGCLHLLGKLIHRDLYHLSQKYGPIMHMKLGVVPTIIISSPQAAELFLKTHELFFSNRPLTQTSKQLSYGRKGIAFAEYGSYWHNIRKICTLELFSSLKINSFSSMRKKEVDFLIHHLREDAKNGVAVDLSSKISCLVSNILCVMVFGRNYNDKEFDEKGVIQEATKLAAAPNLGDFIPGISGLDLQGFCGRAKCVGKVFDGFLERIVDDHLESNNENKTKDFVDVMLDLMSSTKFEYQIDRSSIKAIILDLVLAGVDSSVTAINWVLPELIKHPHVMKKVQEELQKVVGLNRKVEESDLNHLQYLEMVIKEIFRMHPPIPLLPRESIEDCNINGYHIPKKSRIVINAWAIGRDPSTWVDPHKFNPDRFLDVKIKVDMKGSDFQLIPFGYGRRGCPGMQLALIVVRLVVAQLVHCFDWKLQNGMNQGDLDMAEEYGLTCPRSQKLMIMSIYRLCD